MDWLTKGALNAMLLDPKSRRTARLGVVDGPERHEAQLGEVVVRRRSRVDDLPVVVVLAHVEKVFEARIHIVEAVE